MPLSRVASHLLLCAGLVSAQQADKYRLIADAGSTGTRVYLFKLPAGSNEVEITDLGKGKGLSSFQTSTEGVFEGAVGPQLAKAAEMIPAAAQKSVGISVFATAGMRLLDVDVQEKIYGSLRQGFLNAGNLPFDPNQFETRTIAGREEGEFALLAANYLAKNIAPNLSLNTLALTGVLDLGGSSTQIAVPPTLSKADKSVAEKLGKAYIKSYLNLGMERMRQKTWEAILRPSGKERNPCAFPGYKEDLWEGTGRSADCEAQIRAVLKRERGNCDPNKGTDCLEAMVAPKDTKFFLISGYMYVTNFAVWVQEQQKKAGFQKAEVIPLTQPTVDELRQAAEYVCDAVFMDIAKWSGDEKTRHKFTPSHKLGHRCFEINYVVALLSDAYGFGGQDRVFDIVDEINGGEIEWTLGAFLSSVAADSSSGRTEL